MDRSSKSQQTSRKPAKSQARQGETKAGREQRQQIPRRNLMGPAGDPAEGRRDIRK